MAWLPASGQAKAHRLQYHDRAHQRHMCADGQYTHNSSDNNWRLAALYQFWYRDCLAPVTACVCEHKIGPITLHPCCNYHHRVIHTVCHHEPQLRCGEEIAALAPTGGRESDTLQHLSIYGPYRKHVRVYDHLHD